MIEDLDEAAAKAREAKTFEALIEAARQRQRAAEEKAPISRFVLESAQSMSRHMAMSAQDMQDRLPRMALWSLYLQSALGAQVWDFETVRREMPWSYARVRAALAALESRPQLVAAVFHMAAFPLVSALVGSAWRGLHDGPLHLLVASRNMGWFRLGHNRWIPEAADLVSTDAEGLWRLLAGLRDGSITRLLILTDGPHAPGTPGTHALESACPSLAIKTSLITILHTLGIPLLPITHAWEVDRLIVTPRPVLDPKVMSQAETIKAMVMHTEALLRRHPEQWLNWNAAGIRG
jgi:hypothetical protein